MEIEVPQDRKSSFQPQVVKNVRKISDVTDKMLPKIEDGQNRLLDEVCPILYIDAIHYSVYDNGIIKN